MVGRFSLQGRTLLGGSKCFVEIRGGVGIGGIRRVPIELTVKKARRELSASSP
jgi:hypothetical protein